MQYTYKAFVRLMAYYTIETTKNTRDIILDIEYGLLSGKYKIGKATILEVANETLEDRKGKMYNIRGEIKKEEEKWKN